MNNRRELVSLLAGILCVLSTSRTDAAVVHTDTLPPGLSPQFKQQSAYFYLDAELSSESATNNDTNNDPAATYFRTYNATGSWGTSVLNSARFANRGNGDQILGATSLFWENPLVPMAGEWDVYLYHSLATTVTDSSTKSVTNRFYVGSERSGSALLDELMVGSATISTTAAPTSGTLYMTQWDYLGRVVLDGSTLDTFRLSLEATRSRQLADTVLMVRVPEPMALWLFALGGLGSIACVRRRQGSRTVTPPPAPGTG